MKKIVCRVEYDTDAAELIKKRTFGELGDADGYEECLYKCDDGRYFLYVNGGRDSKYPCENIKRMSAKAAKVWLEEN